MGLDSALQIASGGLHNIAAQMAVVSNNVANASTPNYAEEVATQISLVGGGQGFGVLTGNVVRQIDLQLQKEMFQQNATVAGLTVQSQVLAPVDAAQGVPSQGSDLGSALGNLQNAFTSLQTDPSSGASQSSVVNSASALAAKINTIANSYQTARQTAQMGVQSGLQQFNTDVTAVAQLTDQITALTAAGQSTAAAENQRDVAMNDMSKLANVSFISQPNGGMILAVGQGLTIPMTSPAPQFGMANSAISAQTAYPGQGISGITLNGADVTSQFNGGSIGANLALRDKTLPGYQGQLDELANTLQSRFSAQGLQLFTTPTPGSSPIIPTPVQTGYAGYAETIAVNPAVIANPSAVRDGNVTVTGSATGPAAFTPNPAGGPAGFEGLISNVLSYALGSQVQSGVPQPTPNVAGLGVLGNLSAPYSAPATLATFSTVLVSSQSADVANASTQLATESSVQTALQAQFSSTSGVSTDSELSKMVALQNAYGANARIIGAAQTMWTQLINSVQ